jgi:hypothetical protein
MATQISTSNLPSLDQDIQVTPSVPGCTRDERGILANRRACFAYARRYRSRNGSRHQTTRGSRNPGFVPGGCHRTDSATPPFSVTGILNLLVRLRDSRAIRANGTTPDSAGAAGRDILSCSAVPANHGTQTTHSRQSCSGPCAAVYLASTHPTPIDEGRTTAALDRPETQPGYFDKPLSRQGHAFLPFGEILRTLPSGFLAAVAGDFASFVAFGRMRLGGY